MVKTVIGGVDVQQYITAYRIKSPPIMGDNSFQSANGDYVSGIIGSEVNLDITLEEVPTSVSMRLAAVLEAENVEVEYTTPVPERRTFYKTSYEAECEFADPENKNYNDIKNIFWNIQLSLRSVEGIQDQGGGL